MNTEELESRLAEMYPNGVRVCTSLGAPDGHIFWAAAVTSPEDHVLLFKPVGADIQTPYTFVGDPVVDEEAGTVEFHQARAMGAPEQFSGIARLDAWFTPSKEIAALIKAEQEAHNG